MPIPARANIGPPYRGGELAGDPAGLRGVRVNRETLTIDLRPLAEDDRAVVEAIYRLDNPGEPRKLELWFVTGSPEVSDFKVWLGDQLVSAAPVEQAEAPASWGIPPTTPGLNGGGPLKYHLMKSRAIMGFAIELSKGPQTLKVRYRADAVRYFIGEPAMYRQFAYVLAPAKEWGAFGGLDVTVQLPAGWAAASEPALTREGNVLKGTFAHVPADALTLTVQAPVGWAFDTLGWAGIVTLVLAVPGGLVLCGLAGRRAKLRGRPVWLAALVLPLIIFSLIWAAGLIAIHAHDLAAPNQIHHGYGAVYALFGIGLLSLVMLPLGALTCALVAHATRPR
jgi:hypothetical protein